MQSGRANVSISAVSYSLMSVWLRLATFRATWRSALPVKTPIFAVLVPQDEVSHLFLGHDPSLWKSLHAEKISTLGFQDALVIR